MSTPTIIGEYNLSSSNWGGRLVFTAPKICEIFIEKKLFSSIRFEEAGFEAPPFETNLIAMDNVKGLARYFIKEGYSGSIKAYSGYENNSKYDNPERFTLSHSDWLIKLEYYERCSGDKRNLEGIMENFSKLGLTRLK